MTARTRMKVEIGSFLFCSRDRKESPLLFLLARETVPDIPVSPPTPTAYFAASSIIDF